MKLKILLTGGNGFIGKNLVEQLNSKYTFLTPTHNQLELTDQAAVESFFKHHRIDIVIHSANIGGTDKTKHLPNIVETNLRMFSNLLRQHHRFKRLIYFGSGAEYDKRRPLKKIKEIEFGQHVPTDSYGFYKYICSLLSANYPKILNLRLFGVYGKYEDYSQRFISQAVRQVIKNRPITIRQNVYFDYLYINDLVKIVEYFMTHPARYQFYNVGSGQRLSLMSIAKKILSVSKRKLPMNAQKPGLNFEYTCDITRLKQEMPHLKFTPFNKTVKELIAYCS